MVSSRAGGSSKAEPVAGKKRSSASSSTKPLSKKAKKAKDGKLEVGEGGEVGLKHGEKGEAKEAEQSDEKGRGQEESGGNGNDVADGHEGRIAEEDKEDEGDRDVEEEKGNAQVKQDKPGDWRATIEQRASSPGAELDEPKHGTLESGHVYFLYRPKVEMEDANSIDDVSKFHMLLLPKSASHKTHFHRVIEVGKKKMPDPGAKHQVIWGLVGAVGTDKAALKDAFGAYEYETKTRGTRHQPAARPAARGHYILHSPRDTVADDPDRNRQRDFKMLLAYSITTPAPADFGQVQEELGLAPEAVVALSVKEPSAQSNNNPRAAAIPREKRAHYPEHLQALFGNRRWIPANPPAFLSYSGTELLIISSPHEVSDALGEDGEKVEKDLEKDAEKEQVGVEEAMRELGMSKGDTEIEALEGTWA